MGNFPRIQVILEYKYALQEEVEILKEQIKELVENYQLERENSLLKTLASPEQLEKLESQLTSHLFPQMPRGPTVTVLNTACFK
uniref:Uncharacterized protein n=1 Tax=Monodelphis domestica TaxID=13616 RepID=A0A5F8H0X9_MONDO